MTNLIVLGLLGALATGVAIGTQSTISSRVGSLIGSFKAGVMINFVGGILAALIFIALLIIKGRGYWQFSGSAGWYIAAAGALGIVIITGIAYSLRLTGVAAGLSAVILAQLVVSVIVDTRGLGGSQVIPISWTRIIGLVVIAVGVFLLLPKK